jgi:hypothetical protein
MKKLLLVVFIACFSMAIYADDTLSIPTVPAGSASVVSTPAAAAIATAAATATQVVDNTPNAGNQGFRLTLDVDFATVAMKRANDAIAGNTPMTGFGGAFQSMLDLGFAAMPNLFLGGRIGYLYSFPASYEFDSGSSPNIHSKVSMDADLIPLEFGARLRFGIPFTTAGVSVGAYGGMGVALVTNNVNAVKTGKVANYTQSYYGLGFSGELSASLELKLMKGIDVNINGGYRIAGVPSVSQISDAIYTFSGESPVLASGQGTILRDASGTIVPFDFSGMHIGLGISIGY